MKLQELNINEILIFLSKSKMWLHYNTLTYRIFNMYLIIVNDKLVFMC